MENGKELLNGYMVSFEVDENVWNKTEVMVAYY